MRPFAAALLALAAAAAPVRADETIVFDARAEARPFPHVWERMFGSGRAILSLRESYRKDLRAVKQATGFTWVRPHGIFMDEVGVYDEDAKGNPVYNWSYVDQIYDGMLENGVKPFVELSFMPKKLASDPAKLHDFWYKPNVSPPKSWDKWEDLCYQLGKHLVERYGEAEVATWYFEVWNEPNIHFWAGEPKAKTYQELYRRAARGLKRASARLRVGGPATAQAAWADTFIAWAAREKVPLDFFSTHVYANDTAKDVFGTRETIDRNHMVCRAVKKVHDQVKASPMPNLPIIWSEYNASWWNEKQVTDTEFMGPWIADTIRQCDGLVDVMAYWSLSDVFEEQGVVKEPFYGGFGLIAAGNLPKPAFNVFALLHRLGEARIPVESASALVTRRPDGSLAIALWSLALPEEAGSPTRVTLRIAHAPGKRAHIQRVDREHGSLLAAYQAMGRPRYPTAAQLAELRKAAALPPPENARLDGGSLTVAIPQHGLVLVEIP